MDNIIQLVPGSNLRHLRWGDKLKYEAPVHVLYKDDNWVDVHRSTYLVQTLMNSEHWTAAYQLEDEIVLVDKGQNVYTVPKAIVRLRCLDTDEVN